MYKLYKSNKISELDDTKEFIKEVDTIEEVVKFLCTKSESVGNYGHVRYLLNPDATMVDYGSWSQFIGIIPALTPQQLMGTHAN